MNLNSINKVMAFSALLHAVLAAVVVLVVLRVFSYGNEGELVGLWYLSILSAFYFGWIMGPWYLPGQNKAWYCLRYLVTPFVSLVSSVVSSLLFLLYSELGSLTLAIYDLLALLFGGVLIGLYGFVLALPVTVPVGIVVALFLCKLGKRSNTI